MITAASYLGVRADLLRFGYGPEIEWQENAQAPENADDFALEVVFVICNSGMKAQTAGNIFREVMDCLVRGESASSVFGHKLKCRAIDGIWRDREALFGRYVMAPTVQAALECLEEIDHIGPVTKFHVAKNFGLPVVKPDRHLQRLAAAEDCSPYDLCRRLSEETGDTIPVVDLVLWRACNLGWAERLSNGQ